MGMRIRTNVPSLTAQRNLQQNTDNLQKSYDRLSSGYRITKSADDAAGLAVSENIRGEVRGLNQAKRNANDAVSLIQIAEGGMNELGNILVRLRELTVQSSSDTIGDRERGFLNREYTQLVDEIDRISGTVEFNGNKLFEPGEKSEYVIQVGAHNETNNTLTIGLEGLKFKTEDFGFGKGSEIGPSGDGETPTRIDIAAKLNTIDTAMDRVAKERATLGSIQSRLGSSVNNLSVTVENLEQAKSRIRDVDFAEETANMTQSRILSQSNVAVLSQANALPEMALSLLRQ